MAESLPTEITVQILSHLKIEELQRLETVCKSFQSVVSHYIQEINFPTNVEDKVRSYIESRVANINISSCSTWSISSCVTPTSDQSI